MATAWTSKGGRITNGELSLSFTAAYDYIVKETKQKTMADLEIDEAGYYNFKKVVCKFLAVPREFCQ